MAGGGAWGSEEGKRGRWLWERVLLYSEVHAEQLLTCLAGVPFGEVKYIMVSGHMVPHSVDRQTDMNENITLATPLADGRDSGTTQSKKKLKNAQTLIVPG